MYFLRWKICYC